MGCFGGFIELSIHLVLETCYILLRRPDIRIWRYWNSLSVFSSRTDIWTTTVCRSIRPKEGSPETGSRTRKGICHSSSYKNVVSWFMVWFRISINRLPNIQKPSSRYISSWPLNGHAANVMWHRWRTAIHARAVAMSGAAFVSFNIWTTPLASSSVGILLVT